jgi:hypothetical protein
MTGRKPGPFAAVTRRRDDATRLRDRGRYVAECAFCECPVGCACDGEGCACGTRKPRVSLEGVVAAYWDELSRTAQRQHVGLWLEAWGRAIARRETGKANEE